jgi:hypothetical protein
MSEHFIVKCRHCDSVIGQCRCPAKDKLIKYGVCDVCKTLHPLEEKEPQEQATSSTQKSLSVLLDEIEQRALLDHSFPTQLYVPALVKALRRALELLSWGTGKATLLTGTREAELAALLNQGRTSE